MKWKFAPFERVEVCEVEERETTEEEREREAFLMSFVAVAVRDNAPPHHGRLCAQSNG